ncbi:MAG: phytanoyl-CoA dioxygenase family protein [Hyphomonadaceae bacterium]|nr:phytanoyl-CoA dioxygenase family protein [Hyphomonadaceae bacterium]
MEIGNWKSVAGLDKIYRDARQYGIESNIAELEAFGFTIVEPEKTQAPKDFAKRLLDKLMEIARREDAAKVDLNKHEDRPAYGRQLFHLFARDDVFIEAALNPVVKTLAAYMMGSSYRLYSMVAFLKEGTARSTHMHTDSVGVPTPLPFYGSVCNLSWVLTDYTEENGTLGMVPGSHRYCRHPTDFEQPKFLGGPMDDALVAPAIAKPGSLIVFTGNTWHCTYPKTTDTPRAHIATAFCRNYINPAEDYSDMPAATVEKYGAEFARLIGAKSWQGYGEEGPKLERMALVRPAYQSVYG